LAVAVIAGSPAVAGAAESCTRHVEDAKTGPALSEGVVLSAAKGSEQRSVNFDGNRGVKQIKDVVLVSDKTLPDTLKADELNFEALIQRSGETLESVDFSDPTFSEPRFSADRKRITFTICLSGQGVKPGKYVGAVNVSGPSGLGEGHVGVTANLKAKFVIWLVFALAAMLLAGAAMFAKDWTKDRKSITAGWWFKSIGTLVIAFGALIALYLKDPAWGASNLEAALTLVGSALASVGGRKLIE